MRASPFVVALLLAGCGGTATPAVSGTPPPSSTASPSQSTAPTPTPTPVTPYVAVETVSSPQKIELLDLSGHVVASSAPLPQLNSGVVVGIGHRGVYLERSPGSVTVLGVATGESSALQIPQVGTDTSVWVVDSPDGSTLFATVTDFDQSGNTTTRFYTAAPGSTPHLVTTLSRANSPSGGYKALRWDTAGVILGSVFTGVGGVGPFIQEGYDDRAVELMDPQTGTITTLPDACHRWGDRAPDGTLACLNSQGGITVVHGDGTTTPVNHPATDGVGMLTFHGGADHLLYATDTRNSQQNTWTYTLHDVDLSVTPPTDRVVEADTDNLAGQLWPDLIGPATLATPLWDSADGISGVSLLDLASGASRTLATDVQFLDVVHSLG